LQVGDVVVKFDDKKIAKADDFLDLIAKKKPGDTVPIEIRRGPDIIQLKITLGKKDK
jgi:S1-C subfamily serine protease